MRSWQRLAAQVLAMSGVITVAVLGTAWLVSELTGSLMGGELAGVIMVIVVIVLGIKWSDG